MLGRYAVRIFLLPGNLACDALGAVEGDDRSMVRTMVNMLVWNTVAVLIVVATF